DIAEFVQLAACLVGRLELVAVDALRVDEYALQHPLHAGLEPAGLMALLVETHQLADVRLGVEAAVGATRQLRNEAFGATRVVGHARRLADEQAFARRRAAGALRVIRAVDTHAADMRIGREARKAAG